MKDLRTCKVVMHSTKKASNENKEHMYIISDDKIGDYHHYLGRDYPHDNFQLFKTGNAVWNDKNGWGAKEKYKIVATTNDELNIYSKIPESFLKKYAELNGNIHEITVEYQTDWNESTKKIMLGYGDDPDDYPYIPAPKRRDDSTIIIHQTKKYTRDEVEDLIYSAMKDRAYTSLDDFREWIEKNM